MDFKTKKIIKSHIIDYLKVINPSLTITKKGLFECPLKHEHREGNGNPSCNIFPPNSYKIHCFNPVHGKLGDIFDLFRRIEPEMANLSEDEIGEYLVNLLNIKTDDRVDKLLAMYHNLGWCLFPLSKNTKIPVQDMQNWQKSTNRNIEEWKEWVNSGLNLALNLGEKSRTMTIDIDDPATFERIKHLLGNTMVQSTRRGFHEMYAYDKSFDHINHVNLRSKGYEMELRVNNAYIVIAPSIVDDHGRSWNDQKIIQMPKELKEFLLKLIDKEPEQNKDQEIQKAIADDNLNNVNLTGLDGCRNDTFIKIAGILRKKLNYENTEYTLHVFNKLLKKQVPSKEIRAMLREVKKYDSFDKKEMAQNVLSHLKILEQTTARDLKDSLKYEKKDIEDILDYLIKEGKVQKYGRLYKLIQKVDWQTNFMSVGTPLKVKVPFFEKYARFENGSMIVLGGKSGEGKSHLACNFLKGFIEQKITPYYICTEAGSKFGKITATLGLKEGDYYFKIVGDPTTIELENDAITIIDWLKPKDSDYAKTDTIYERLNDQLLKHRGLLIVFAQLRKSGEFFAPDMIDFFASLVAKYCHSRTTDKNGNITLDNENTYWKTEKIRDSKIGNQYITIPTHYNRESKLLTLRGKE